MQSTSNLPKVSAVITTLRRPHLVVRAIRSVLRQTLADLELIVVVDGPDGVTAQVVSQISDTRLQLVVLPENVGISEARNEGVRAAQGAWVAFLDDDDEWLPQKLEMQYEVALKYGSLVNFVACRYREQNLHEVRLRPKRFPTMDEDWGIAFYRHAGILLPSTFFVKKSLMLSIPFSKDLRRSEDVDWCLRAKAAGKLYPRWVQEALTIYHSADPTNTRLSLQAIWREQYDWLLRTPGLLSRKSVPYYLGMICIPEAKRSASPIAACTLLLKEALRRGSLTPHSALYLLIATFSSIEFRSRLRRRLPFLQRRSALQVASGKNQVGTPDTKD